MNKLAKPIDEMPRHDGKKYLVYHISAGRWVDAYWDTLLWHLQDKEVTNILYTCDSQCRTKEKDIKWHYSHYMPQPPKP